VNNGFQPNSVRNRTGNFNPEKKFKEQGILAPIAAYDAVRPLALLESAARL
jgi:hypothetical protein